MSEESIKICEEAEFKRKRLEIATQILIAKNINTAIEQDELLRGINRILAIADVLIAHNNHFPMDFWYDAWKTETVRQGEEEE